MGECEEGEQVEDSVVGSCPLPRPKGGVAPEGPHLHEGAPGVAFGKLRREVQSLRAPRPRVRGMGVL